MKTPKKWRTQVTKRPPLPSPLLQRMRGRGFLRHALSALVAVQVAPELVEVKIVAGALLEKVVAAATSLVPSTEAATEYQVVLGRPVAVHETPPLVEV